MGSVRKLGQRQNATTHRTCKSSCRFQPLETEVHRLPFQFLSNMNNRPPLLEHRAIRRLLSRHICWESFRLRAGFGFGFSRAGWLLPRSHALSTLHFHFLLSILLKQYVQFNEEVLSCKKRSHHHTLPVLREFGLQGPFGGGAGRLFACKGFQFSPVLTCFLKNQKVSRKTSEK